MDDPIFKQKYQKYKLRVKLWEKDFKKKNGRIPSKYDIRDASQEIRDSYKMYYKLKTSFLEDTLNDVLSDDGFDILEMSQLSQREGDMDLTLNESIDAGSTFPIDINRLVGTDNQLENSMGFSNIHEITEGTLLVNPSVEENCILKNFEPTEELDINKNAWGVKVSKKPIVLETKEGTRSAKRNFNQKLFQSSSFSKRNPRKSLPKPLHDNSFKGVSSTLNTISNASEVSLPDLETILLQKAKEQQAVASLIHSLPKERVKETIKIQVDDGWLERNAADDSIAVKATKISDIKHARNSQNKSTQIQKSKFGLANLDVSKIQRTATDAFTDGKILINTENEINKNNEISPIKNGYFETTEKDQSKSAFFKESDSDSIVDDSDNEKESQEYRHITKRRKIIRSTSNADENKAIISNRRSDLPKDPPKKQVKSEDLCISDKVENKKASRKKVVAKTKIIKSTSNADENKGIISDRRSDLPKDPPKKQVKSEEICISDKVENMKESRKKVVAKRKSDASKKEKPKPIKKAVPKTKSTRKKHSETTIEEDLEDKPLNPEDLKYALALERCDITSVPRIKLKELDNAEHLAQDYINKLALIPGAEPSTNKTLTAAAEKRAAEKRKLEAKIASGKLNENFVTINIQKKTFVRGKKTINYSKYKKKMWKDKKRVAALTGPNMDMRGCDGGTLKCFTCGQAGHFAQNCKTKADSLLPLTAQLEDDPSPFPTLDEAEQMASQSALAVHSRNIAKLPQAPNSAIYETNILDDNGKVEGNPGADGGNGNVNSEGNSSKADNTYSGDLFIESGDELEAFDVDAATATTKTELSPPKKFTGHKIPESFLKAAGLDGNELSTSTSTSSKFGCVKPLYELNPDGSVKEVTPEVLDVLKLFGHTNFRKGQDRAVMRILSGMSTLVTLSTGSGKSLCYQLPAYMYARQCKCITLVISPLVSLMEDQVTGVPHFLRAHCLHTNQTPQQRVKIMQRISDGEVDVLLVSPEAVVAGERSTGFGSILRQLPPIAFACIDEAHCVSQWSHNFRHSYLMICKVLKKNLGVRCVLGLTATATMPTRLSIINHLSITDGDKGIISDTPLPDNLILSVSKDENKDAALLQLLLSKRFESCQSIIVYCTRRDECERVASFLRTCLQDRKTVEPINTKKKRKRVNWHAEPYHAGMHASRRKTIQNAFMNNELRIVVATVAFGMGINKPDIRAVIHYNMPSNFESYVQEVGRAGRDNKVSHCHLFLDAHGSDKSELKRHIYANSLDRHVIRKLLQRIFVPCSCDSNIKDGVRVKPKDIDFAGVGETNTTARYHICPGHEIAFSVEKTVEALDIPSENISTLLCYMELDNRWNMNVLSNAYVTAKVISYGGHKYLKHAAKECPPLAMAIAMEIKNGTFKETENIIEFSVVDIAAAIGWNSGVVKYQLKQLEWVQINGYPKRSPITVSFYDLGFRIKAPGDFTIDEIDDALDTLYNRSCEQERKQLIQLQYVFQGLSSVSYNSYVPCCSDNFSHDRSDQLKAIIRNYFLNDYPKDLKLEVEPSNICEADIESDVLSLINMYPENNFTGRNVARIFHGISSPNYPAVMWYRCKYWRAHCKTDFNRIVQVANSAIVKWRS